MVRIQLPSPERIERAIKVGGARGIDAAMATVLTKSERIAPYDVTERDMVHLRAHGTLHKAIGVGSSVVGSASYTVHNPSDGYSYARAMHEGYWHEADGTRVPARGYVRYTHPSAKRRFLAVTMRTNRRSLKRTVASSIRRELRGRGL